MLTCMQKINCITHFLLSMLQRNSRLNILSNLGMPGHTPKRIVSLWRNLQHLSAGKTSTSFFTFSLINCKLAVFGTLSMSGYAHPKWYYQLVESFCVYLQTKNQLHPSCFYGDIENNMQTYFGSFRQAWLHSPKMIVSTCRGLSCLSVHKKINFIINLFLKILHFK